METLSDKIGTPLDREAIDMFDVKEFIRLVKEDLFKICDYGINHGGDVISNIIKIIDKNAGEDLI